MQTLDLLHGTRTTRVDLGAVPFLSRLGPNEGTMDLIADASGRLVDLHVSIRSSRRVLLRELERIAVEATWNVPVELIRRTTTPHFVVDLELDPDGKQRLAETEIRLEGASLEQMNALLRPLLKDKHYQVSNIREVHPSR
jgi:hypothetical protein